MAVTIQSLDALLTLPRNASVNGLGERSCVRLSIPGLDPRERALAERTLNRLQSRCGCIAAGVTTLAVTIAGLVRWYPSAGIASTAGARLAGAMVVAGLGAGMLAKLTTLLITRVQFARLCRAQHDALSRLCQASGTG